METLFYLLDGNQDGRLGPGVRGKLCGRPDVVTHGAPQEVLGVIVEYFPVSILVASMCFSD